ncbi:CaiB/BaiF CoA transferase family protein [Chloroflexota bacterium]
MKQCLSGITVIDLTHYIAGPYCTKLLAGLGAEVIKIEKPGEGDGARRLGPFPGDRPDPEQSGLFLYLNTGKKSITLNLKTKSGVHIFKQLIADADVVVESFEPRVMPSLGLGYKVLEAINPRLVMTSISNFGQNGPYKGYKAEEITEQALSGLMYITGEPDREPLKSGGSLAQYIAGETAFAGTMTALLYAQATDTGQQVDVSIMEANAEMVETRLQEYFFQGTIDYRRGNFHPTTHPHKIYPCKDGWVFVTGNPLHNWPEMAKLMEEPRLADAKFATKHNRMEYRDEVDALMEPWLMSHTKEEIYYSGQAHGLAFGYVATPEDLAKSKQLRAREYFVEIEHPVAGKLRYPGGPYRMSETPFQFSPAPLLGEHNEEVYDQRLGFSKEDIVRLRQYGVI